MSLSNPYSQYIDNQIMTATPGKLLLMTYDAAIKFGRIAGERMKERNLFEQSTYITKMQNILVELINTLNPNADAELAASLESIYMYMFDRLTHASIRDDLQALEEVIVMLTDLRASWAEAEFAIRSGADKVKVPGALAS